MNLLSYLLSFSFLFWILFDYLNISFPSCFFFHYVRNMCNIYVYNCYEFQCISMDRRIGSIGKIKVYVGRALIQLKANIDRVVLVLGQHAGSLNRLWLVISYNRCTTIVISKERNLSNKFLSAFISSIEYAWLLKKKTRC